MTSPDTWILLFVGASVGSSVGFILGSIFTRIKIDDEQAEAAFRAEIAARGWREE